MFMKRQYDDPAAKVNIGRAEYMLHLRKAAKEDDMPEAVMCLPILSAQRRGQLTAILELRHANAPINIQEVHARLPTQSLVSIRGPLQLEANVSQVTLLILIDVTRSRTVRREERVARG